MLRHITSPFLIFLSCATLAVLAIWNSVFAQSQSGADDRDVSVAARKAGLENVLQVSERILSGSEPSSKNAFRFLKVSGISTIVSVDGAPPDIAAATAEGLRYVHIPIGYDGIPENARLSLLRLLRETDGEIYIHCHHGKHRGPAAAAIACRLDGTADRDRALQIMHQAGTNEDYAGLWQAVRDFQMPSTDTKLPQLVETAAVESMAVSMAKLSRHFDDMKLCQQAGWITPASHPDVNPVHESLLLAETLRETKRLVTADYDERFRRWMAESETLAHRLHRATKTEQSEQRDSLLAALKKSCQQCHQAYRN